MEQKEKRGNMSAIDVYVNGVYKLVLILVPGACMSAGILYTIMKLIGFLPTVNLGALITFDITCVIYLLIGIMLIKTGIKDGVVQENKLKIGKIFLAVIMLIQYNFILYLIPATDFWGFAFFFVVLTAFFLDYKLVAVTSIEIAASIVGSWILKGDIHLPARDGYFAVNILDRAVCIVLSLLTLVLLAYLIKRILVNAKQDEMQQNMEQVERVLAAVSELSENLRNAGNKLAGISETEGASAQELAATSEELAASSNELMRRADEGTDNLNELSEWESAVSEDVQRVEAASHDLLVKSEENQKILDDLQTINGDVSASMKATTDIAGKLSDAVEEIGVTLNLISEISESTNLLALNASIEAARAGEAGKGFAVVATEVGKLASNTQDTLKDVEEVIARVQESVRNITAQVNDNAEKLASQNDYVMAVFKSMKDMTELLNVSIEAINAMSDAHGKQAEVIKNTIAVNQDIADGVRNENTQFATISSMAESNANETSELALQAKSINGMVEQLGELLAY